MDSFVSNLGRIYAIYTGSFLAFVIVLAVLEQMGMPDQWIGYAFVLLTIGVYAGIGYISRTAQVSEYYVAGRRVPAFYNGMATAADWMSAASFIGMAGSLYLQGYDGLAFVLGWTGGYVLVAVLVAPYLRKFGAYTVPDFLAARYEGNVARFVGVIVLISCSFIYLMGQLTGTGLVMSRLIGIPFEYGVFVGLAGILVCSMLGGMRAVTWTQVAQYIVLIIAYLIPVIILSTQTTGVPVPQIMYGGVLRAGHRARADGALHRALCRRGQGPRDGVLVPRPAQLLRPDLLPDDRHGVPAARHHALLHHPFGARGAQVGRLVAPVHLHPLLHRARLRGVREVRGVHQRAGQGSLDPRGDHGPAGLDLHLRQARAGQDLRRQRREPGRDLRRLPGGQGRRRCGGPGDPADLQPVHDRRRHDRAGHARRSRACLT